MYDIIKQYQVGRGVAYYDIQDVADGTVKEKVSKSDIVKACEAGQIHNAKIQYWEGSAIVRLSSDDVPKVKLIRSQDGSEEEVAVGKVTRNHSKTTSSKSMAPGKVATGKVGSVTYQMTKNDDDVCKIPSRVVGKLDPKKARRELAYTGYDPKALTAQMLEQSKMEYKSFDTLLDMLNSMMEQFKISDKITCTDRISKKLKLGRKVSGIAQGELAAIQDSLAVYLMNFAYAEIRDVYAKYKRPCTCG